MSIIMVLKSIGHVITVAQTAIMGLMGIAVGSVKRFGLLMSMVLSLFMFQSLWNVAAAFCTHEVLPNKPASLTSAWHFGHHVAFSCPQDQHIDAVNPQHSVAAHDSLSSTFNSNIQDDHSDHLPSFAHFIIADVQQKTEPPRWSAYIAVQLIDWKNLYQSPYLSLKNPPPVPSPL